MVLSCVDLFQNSTHSRLVWPNDNEEVFAEEAKRGVGIDDFNMGQVLTVRAHLVLTLHDQYAPVSQYPVGFPATLLIEIHDCSMPLPPPRLGLSWPFA